MEPNLASKNTTCLVESKFKAYKELFVNISMSHAILPGTQI